MSTDAERATELEAVEEGEGAEDVPVAEEQEPQETEKPKPSNELKIVIILKDSNIMLGVQSPDCDPVYTTLKSTYTTLKGTLTAALKRVPKLVDEAKQKWNANPRYPKADLPAPPPSPTPARTPAAASKPETTKPSFF